MLPVATFFLSAGHSMFKKTLTIEFVKRSLLMSGVTADKKLEQLVESLREKKSKFTMERPPQMPLQKRFANEKVCEYLKSAFKVSDDLIEEAEDEVVCVYNMNRHFFVNMIDKNNTRVVQYLAVGDVEGSIHIYVLCDVLASKSIGVTEVPKQKASVQAGFKRDSLNVTLEVQTSLAGEVNHYIPHTLDANNCLRVKHWIAHQGRIVSMKTIPQVK